MLVKVYEMFAKLENDCSFFWRLMKKVIDESSHEPIHILLFDVSEKTSLHESFMKCNL